MTVFSAYISRHSGREFRVMDREKLKITVSLLIFTVSVFILICLIDLISRFLLSSLPLNGRLLIKLGCYWLLIPVIGFSMRRHNEKLTDIGFESINPAAQIVTGLVIALVMCFVLIAVPAMYTGRTSGTGPEKISLLSSILGFISSVSGTALVNETVWRGIVYKRLNEQLHSVPLTIVITSILSGLLHYFSGSILSVVTSAIIAAFLCFCIIRIRHCTLLSIIIAHGIYEFFASNRNLTIRLFIR